MLLLHHLPAWHWGVGGAAIAAVTLALLYVANQRLGISTSFESVCAIASRAPYFKRADLGAKGRWRLYFLGGLLLGGVLSAVLGGGWDPFWDLGRFDAHIGWGPVGKSAWMVAGGALIGFGTRLAGGCTSGHGIFGVAHLERASWTSMVTFMVAGMVATHVVYRVLFPAGAP